MQMFVTKFAITETPWWLVTEDDQVVAEDTTNEIWKKSGETDSEESYERKSKGQEQEVTGPTCSRRSAIERRKPIWFDDFELKV